MISPGLRLARLYAITDLAASRLPSHCAIVGQLLEGGCRCIQIREKSLPDDQLHEQVRRSLELCEAVGARLLINDRVDLAWAIGAHGVHLGQEDLAPTLARKLVGPACLLGQSTHSLQQALAAQADEAVDYVAIGPIFHTGTKKSGNQPIELEGLCDIRRHVSKPLVAIGGINADNVVSVLRTGCDSVAIISALMSADSIAIQTRALVSLIGSC